jgi:hypothetical protein
MLLGALIATTPLAKDVANANGRRFEQGLSAEFRRALFLAIQSPPLTGYIQEDNILRSSKGARSRAETKVMQYGSMIVNSNSCDYSAFFLERLT